MPNEHYKSQATEPIEILESIDEREEIPAKPRANISRGLKYILRAGLKAGADWREDLRKGIDYFERALLGHWKQ